jgi:hypothetical protein
LFSKPGVAAVNFFSLDGKEAKDQEQTIASGRLFGPARLGGDLANGSCKWQSLLNNTSFINYFFR